MSYLDPMETPQARVSPALMMGVASPLWGYFGAAAAGGLAFWWMTRWTRPVNLEALFAKATDAAAPVLEPMIEAIEVLAEVVAEEPGTLVAAAMHLEPEPVAVAAASLEPVADAEPVEAVIEAAAESVESAAGLAPEPEAAVEAEAAAEALPAALASAIVPEAPARARPKKTTPPAAEPEA